MPDTRSYGHCVDRIRVPNEGMDEITSLQIPEFEGVVEGARDLQAVVRRHGPGRRSRGSPRASPARAEARPRRLAGPTGSEEVPPSPAGPGGRATDRFGFGSRLACLNGA